MNGQIEVLMDGGIRRGTDIVKALCCGRALCFVAALTPTDLLPQGKPASVARSRSCGLIWSAVSSSLGAHRLARSIERM